MYNTPRAIHFNASLHGQVLPGLNEEGLRARWNVARKLEHLDFFTVTDEDIDFIQRVVAEANKHSSVQVALDPAYACSAAQRRATA